MRVIGFEFAVNDTLTAGHICSKPERRRNCPVSPLGDMLSKHDISSDDQSRGSESFYAESDGYYGGDVCCDSQGGYSWKKCEFESHRARSYVRMDAGAAPFYPGSQSIQVAVNLAVSFATSSTSSEPIPIPKKPKPPKTKKPEEQKNLKRVPEPPMVKAITAPAIVEEIYAEYDRLKQIAEEDELYEQMMLAQGQKPRRRIKTVSVLVNPLP